MALSDAESHYLTQSIQLGLRLDGRGLRDVRPMELELGLIAQASGSARLHMGATDVLVGVKVHARAGNTWRLAFDRPCGPRPQL